MSTNNSTNKYTRYVLENWKVSVRDEQLHIHIYLTYEWLCVTDFVQYLITYLKTIYL